MLSEREGALLAEKANKEVAYQVKSSRNAEQEALISCSVSVADVRRDDKLAEINTDSAD